jgi:rare lipoprotein A
MKKQIVTILLLLLCNCSFIKSYQSDGPPMIDMSYTHIEDAKPKKEALSKYGNPSSYTVFGKKYTVLKNAANFKQSGIASWYGTKFNGKLTSNRERYNMLAMTAAHKTLPLPCYVRVTRTDTNKSIIVRVNDRGPFVDKRIIDLSYAGAKKLDMLKYGTAPVTISAISFGEYWLQAGAFKTAKNAKQQQELIQQQTSLIAKITHPDKWYKIQIGPFENEEEALNAQNQLADVGLKSIKTKA